jgi:hypothetical protein
MNFPKVGKNEFWTTKCQLFFNISKSFGKHFDKVEISMRKGVGGGWYTCCSRDCLY